MASLYLGLRRADMQRIRLHIRPLLHNDVKQIPLSADVGKFEAELPDGKGYPVKNRNIKEYEQSCGKMGIGIYANGIRVIRKIILLNVAN